MSTTSLILFVIAGLFMAWQVVLVILASSMVRAGRYTNVTISIVPLLIATAVCIAGIFTR